MTGHEGKRRTTVASLQTFIGQICTVTSNVFQRATRKGKVAVAPLGNIPLMRTPGEHVLVDLIGPFPSLFRTQTASYVKIDAVRSGEDRSQVRHLLSKYQGISSDLPGKSKAVEFTLRRRNKGSRMIHTTIFTRKRREEDGRSIR